MSVKTAIENLAEPIGFDISQSDDKVQADLFNGLGRGFKTYNETNLHTQICCFSQKLTPEAREFVKILNDYCQNL